MITNLLLFLLPVAAFSGWYVANKSEKPSLRSRSGMVPKDYLKGLNFLLNEEPDKAVDIFIRMLEVDSDTVETHLALGSLFRRRGEVDRAIRIHQNLIARPHLDKQQRLQSLVALGQDYMRAGVLDRAERIFLEIVEEGQDTLASLEYLLDIYQQEKAWEQAITTAQKIAIISRSSDMHKNIAHYYCELAIKARDIKDVETVRKYLRKALTTDKNCVRASLLQGDLEANEQRYKIAIKFYKSVKDQDADYLSEAIIPLSLCYEKLNDVDEFLNYLKECLDEYSRISLLLLLADYIAKRENILSASNLISDYLRHHPSIRGLQRLIHLQLLQDKTTNHDNLEILSDITTIMLKNKPVYRCNDCGFSAKNLHWLCPSCKSWSTVKPIHGLEGD